MQDLFKEMADQMNVIDPTDESFKPREKPQKGEVILGSLTVKLRQLFIFYLMAKAKVTKQREKDDKRIVAILHTKELKADTPDWKFLAAHTVAREEADFIRKAFIHGVKRHFSRAALATNIAVRYVEEQRDDVRHCEWVAVIPVGSDMPNPEIMFRIELNAH